MGDITVNNASVFTMTEGGESALLGDAINVKTVEDGNGTESIFIGSLKDQYEIRFTLDYISQHNIFKIFFGISNNYRRMHGGFALRENTMRNWYKKHRRI